MKDAHEKLPSGKNILRQHNDPAPNTELHYYADGHKIKIGIQFTYGNGAKLDETYFLKGDMVGRKAYEKARIAYPDMPAADDKIEDRGAGLLRMVAKELNSTSRNRGHILQIRKRPAMPTRFALKESARARTPTLWCG